MKDRRPLIFLIALLVVAGASAFAIRSGADSGPEAGPSAPVTQLVPTTAPPLPEWRIALDQVTLLENQAFISPDPALASAFMTKGCNCYGETVKRLTALRKAGHHFAGDTVGILEATPIGEVTSTEAKLSVVVGGVPNPRVDASGTVIADGPEGSIQLTYLLKKEAGGVWRIADRRPS